MTFWQLMQMLRGNLVVGLIWLIACGIGWEAIDRLFIKKDISKESKIKWGIALAIVIWFIITRQPIFDKYWDNFWYWYNLWDVGALAYQFKLEIFNKSM